MSTSVWNVHVCCISDWLVWRILTYLILFVSYIVTIIIHVQQQVHTVYIISITIHTHLSLRHEVEFTCVDDLWFYMNCAFLGAFAKLRKATISFIMSVCLSICLSVRPSVCPYVRMEQFDCHWTDYHEIWCLSIFSKICRKNSSYIKTCQE